MMVMKTGAVLLLCCTIIFCVIVRNKLNKDRQPPGTKGGGDVNYGVVNTTIWFAD